MAFVKSTARVVKSTVALKLVGRDFRDDFLWRLFDHFFLYLFLWAHPYEIIIIETYARDGSSNKTIAAIRDKQIIELLIVGVVMGIEKSVITVLFINFPPLQWAPLVSTGPAFQSNSCLSAHLSHLLRVSALRSS